MKHLVPILFFFTFLSACEVPWPKPNEPFYCKIDGKTFRPDSDSDIFPFGGLQLTAELDKPNNHFNIIAIDAKGDYRSVSFSIKLQNAKLEARRYSINEEAKAYCTPGYIKTDSSTSHHNYDAYEKSGYIQITKIDTLKREVSGLFEFRAKSTYTDDELGVTKGCFNDMYYY